MPRDEFLLNVFFLKDFVKVGREKKSIKLEEREKKFHKIYHQCQEGKRDKLKPLKIPHSHTKLKMILGYYWWEVKRASGERN